MKRFRQQQKEAEKKYKEAIRKQQQDQSEISLDNLLFQPRKRRRALNESTFFVTVSTTTSGISGQVSGTTTLSTKQTETIPFSEEKGSFIDQGSSIDQCIRTSPSNLSSLDLNHVSSDPKTTWTTNDGIGRVDRSEGMDCSVTSDSDDTATAKKLMVMMVLKSLNLLI